MKKNKYIPLVIAIIIGCIMIPFLTGGDDGRYVVSYDEIKPVKSYKPSKIKLYVENLKSLQKEYISMKLEFQRMSIWTTVLFSTVGMLVSYSSYGWGIYRVWSGAITYGTMTMFLGLSGTLTGAMNNLTSVIPSIISLTTSAGRLMDIVEMPREDYSKDDEAKAFMEKYKDEGISLKISDITFKYKAGVVNVFEDASMDAHPHEIVALVGPSGEGKTTMLRLLLSLIFSGEGDSVIYNGIKENENTEYMTLSPSARKMFSYVPQGNSLLSGTIRENMLLANPSATEAEIIENLKLASAEFVLDLPNGLDTVCGESGSGLSEGQCQRIAIARALLHPGGIMILDEATSALDLETEERLLRSLHSSVSGSKTIVFISHRPAALAIADDVVNL